MKIQKIILSLSIIISFQSCGILVKKAITVSKAKKEYTVENYAIPPEFGKNNNEVLIGILKGPKDYNNYLKRKIEKSYNGNYVLISDNELNSKKYSDLKKYRYLFTYKEGTKITTSIQTINGFTSGGSSYILKKLYVYDRLKKNEFISGAEFKFWAKSIEIYLEQLEKQRIKNEK